MVGFAGEAPVALAAQVQSPPGDPRFGEMEDVCAAQLRFSSGATASISASSTTALNRIALCGDEALATLSPATPCHGNRLTVSTQDRAGRQVGAPEKSDVQFHCERDHPSEAIDNGTGISTPGGMGLRDVRLIEAL